MEGETLKNKWKVFRQHETFTFRGTSDVKRRKLKKGSVLHRKVFEVASFSLKADGGNQYDVFSKKLSSMASIFVAST